MRSVHSDIFTAFIEIDKPREEDKHSLVCYNFKYTIRPTVFGRCKIGGGMG